MELTAYIPIPASPLDTSILDEEPNVIVEPNAAVSLANIPYPPCVVPVEIIFPLLFMFIVQLPYDSGPDK